LSYSPEFFFERNRKGFNPYSGIPTPSLSEKPSGFRVAKD
jgi:hypothetical protein